MTSEPPEIHILSRRPTTLGTQQFINPKYISADNDIVMLSTSGKVIRWLAVILSVLVMLLGIGMIIDGVYGLGGGQIRMLFNLATHPLIGLALGILVTAVLQSSSTTTALTVTAVGVGLVPVEVAIPIILGANIGTTITVFLVSFTFVRKRKQFRRAFTSASLHGLFNILLVAIILPVELLFSPLERLSRLLTETVLGADVQISDAGVIFTVIFQPVIDFFGMDGLLGSIFDLRVAAALCLLSGTLLILLGVRSVSAQLRILMAATTRTLLAKSSGASDALGFLSGLGGTLALQASTVTVSSLVPFAAEKSLRPRELLTITLGANVGTTLSSVVIALTLPGNYGGFALQAAVIHLLFNLIGSLVVLLVPPVRTLILFLAEKLAGSAQRSYSITFSVIMAFYILIPVGALTLYSIFS